MTSFAHLTPKCSLYANQNSCLIVNPSASDVAFLIWRTTTTSTPPPTATTPTTPTEVITTTKQLLYYEKVTREYLNRTVFLLIVKSIWKLHRDLTKQRIHVEFSTHQEQRGNQLRLPRVSPPPLIFAYIFPRWVMSPCFIPFSNVCNPSCASQRLYVLGCLATFACFPTLGIDLMSVPSLRFGCIFCLEVWLPFGVIHFCCVFRGGVGCSGWGWGLG